MIFVRKLDLSSLIVLTACYNNCLLFVDDVVDILGQFLRTSESLMFVLLYSGTVITVSARLITIIIDSCHSMYLFDLGVC